MKYRPLRIISCIVAISLVATIGLVSVAAASPASHVPRVKLHRGTSLNWSGYAVETSLTNPAAGAVTNVSGSWVVPTVTGTGKQTAYSSAWVGIDGYSSGTVEQIGTDSDWIKGRAVYYAWFEMYPARSMLVTTAVSPGDAINASVNYLGSGQFRLSISNATKGWSWSTVRVSTVAQRSSAEWVQEAPSSGRILPLANFGTVSFTNCQATLNGVTGPIGTWQYDPMSMVTKTGTLKAQPSALTSGGSAFTVTWFHQ